MDFASYGKGRKEVDGFKEVWICLQSVACTLLELLNHGRHFKYNHNPQNTLLSNTNKPIGRIFYIRSDTLHQLRSENSLLYISNPFPFSLPK